MNIRDPWHEFAYRHQRGDRIRATIKSVTDFGLFVSLDGGVVGLVHISDLDWVDAGQVAIKRYSAGDAIDAVILALDPERQRISLGIKQCAPNPGSTPRRDIH
jgi:small subunit ribosomal protein S1